MLRQADRAYRAGDFRTARKLAKRARTTEGRRPEVAERADRLLAATGVDPVATAVFVGTLALLTFLVVRYLL
jgi:hypothetical protein